jgi:hypothetical protein
LPAISSKEVLQVESSDDEQVDPAANNEHRIHNFDGSNDNPNGKDDAMVDPTSNDDDEIVNPTGEPDNSDEVDPDSDNNNHGEN